jgi:plasmid stabilization system protein ParE
MAEFRVILSDEAKRNIEEIHLWIAERSVDGAARWYLTLSKALDELKSSAERFAVAAESRHFSEIVRSASFRMRSGRSYRILFTIAGNEVHILYVRGPGQDWVAP